MEEENLLGLMEEDIMECGLTENKYVIYFKI
jgi:hypothetical protein